MVIKMNNPFDSLDENDSNTNEDESPNDTGELNKDAKAVMDEMLKSLLQKQKPSSNTDEAFEEAKKEFLQELEEEELKKEVIDDVTRTREEARRRRINERRKLKRKLQKGEKITNLMLKIKPRYEDKWKKIVELVGGDTNRLIEIQRLESLYLQQAQPNQWKSYEESLEECYKLFLDLVIVRLLSEESKKED